MDRSPLVLALGLSLGIGLVGCRAPTATITEPSAAHEQEQPYAPYLERRAAHATKLRLDAPSPGPYDQAQLPDGVREVRYAAGELELLAWLALPASGPRPAPALAYFHGAFALTPKDLAAVRPFLEAGFVVLMPAWRGENGNPGRLELLYGEVDDAVAATRWLAARPEVDPSHVYAAGHSIGGGVAALLALRPDAPVRLTASVGGLYVPQTFQRWAASEGNAALVRFDPADIEETTLRTLGPNVRDLVHPHFAYVGDDDTWFHPNAEAIRDQAERWGVPLTVERVPGDHMTSVTPGLARFLVRIETDIHAESGS